MENIEPQSTNDNGQTPPVHGDAKPHVVKTKSVVWRRTRQVAAWLLLLLILIGFAGVLFIQLPVFKRLVINELVSAVEKGTNGTLIIKEVKGNLLQGFVMNDVTLKLKTNTAYDSVTFLHADHILAKYSLIRWLRKNEFGITSMVLEHPVVRFVKFAGDTVWNYSLLTKPVPTANKPPPTPFTQILDLASFRILNGELYVRNYNFPARQTAIVTGAAPSRQAPSQLHEFAAQVKESDIDWADIQVQGIDLDSRFYAHGSSAQSARVSHLRFTEKQSGFFVQHLEFSGYVDSIQARMDDAKITTGHSDVGFSVELAPPSIVKTGLFTSLQHSSVKVSMNGPVISTYELKQFLPKPLGFLAGSPGIDLETNGEFGKLHVKRLALDFKNRGNILIAGDLSNLHHTDSLTMDIKLQGRNLSNATLNDYVPGLHLPDLSRFGNINIGSLTYTGEPLNFHTIFDAKSSGAGNITADVMLNLHNHQFKYTADLKTQNFNIAALIKKPEFESSISTDAKLAGTGTNWKTLTTDITLKETAPSFFGKYHVNSLDLAGSMKSGTLTTDHLDAVVQGGPEVHVRSASANLVAPSIPFRFDGTVKDFRLAEVMGKNSANPSRVDLDAKVAGTAKNFEDLTGTLHARLFDLEYKGHPMQDVIADATLAPTRSGDNALTINSQMADVSVQHRFRLGDLIHAVPEHVNALITAIEQRDFPVAGEQYPVIRTCSDSADFNYKVTIKDLRPLADFLPRTFLLGEGVISGSVSGCPNGDMDITINGDSLGLILRNRISIDSSLAIIPDSDLLADSISTVVDTNSKTPSLVLAHRDSVSHFDTARLVRKDSTHSPMALPQFGQGIPRVHVTPTTFRLVAHNLSNDPKKVLGHLDAALDFMTDSVVRLGSAFFEHPKAEFVYQNQVLNFGVSTQYNNSIGAKVKGTAHFPNGDFDFIFDTLRFVYDNPSGEGLRQYIWMNEDPSHVIWTKAGRLTIDTLNIIHPLMNGANSAMQRMSLGGTLQGDSVNAWVEVPSFQLDQLPRILPFRANAKTFGFAKFNGKVRDVRGTLSGTLERPEITAKLFADSLTYGDDQSGQISFDSNAVDISYRDQALRGSLIVHVANVTGMAQNGSTIRGSELRATIDSIPMTIALKRGPTYEQDSAAAVVRPLSASINASQFPLDVATPFIPPFSKIEGTGDIHFAVTGTRQNVQYTGQATINDAAFLLASTNMWYRVAGPLTFADNSLKLQNLTIRNVDADDPNGMATLNGNLDFQGFNITNFDLRLHSDRLMVLTNAARESLGTVYGPVTINTDGEDFHFYNTFQNPIIRGTINIVSANVIMPQTGGTNQNVTGGDIIYETLPNDSIENLRRARRAYTETERTKLEREAGSIRLSMIDDTLFPNNMKEIYYNDDGTALSHDTTGTTPAGSGTANTTSFTDRLQMDLRINTQGDATITIPFSGALGVLGTQLKAELKSGGSLQLERGENLQTTATGGFDLSPNSSFRFYQTFNITDGRIRFTNDFSNPEINVTADYIGTNQYDQQQAKIELQLTGTKSNPLLTARVYESGATGDFVQRPETSDQALEDAIYFLTTGGYFKNEANDAQAQKVLAQAGSTLSSQLFSDFLSNYLGSSGSAFAIRSATYQVGQGVQLTAAYRNITFKTELPVGNNNTGQQAAFITDIPFNTFMPGNASRNMLLEIQLHLNQQSTTASTLTQQPFFLGKLIWTPFVW